MRRVLWIVAVASIVVALAWWVALLPGTVSAAAFGITVEAATPVAAVALVLGILTIHLVLRLVGGLFGLPGSLRFWRRARRQRIGDAAVGRALVALAAGEAASARRESQRARRALGDTLQTLLMAAEAARLAGNPVQAEALYQAMAARPDAAFLGLRGLFRQAVEREDWKEATSLARRAEALQPGGNWLREARLRLAEETGDWSRSQSLTGPGVPPELVATAAANASADPQEAARLAQQAWRANRSFAPAVVAYAAALRRQGRDQRAEEVVVEAWRAAPHPDLATFLLSDVSDARARLRLATVLSTANAEHIETQFLIARLSLAAGELREARYHAERAQSLGPPTRRVFMLMADLAVAEGHDPAPALRGAAAAPPDPAWGCGQCGAVHVQWHPVCPSCHTAGHIRWGQPAATPRALTAT